MYRNLNQLINSDLQFRYNNGSLDDGFEKYYSVPIVFSYNDLLFNPNTKQIIYIAQDRLIRNCVIKCPNGQILDNLQYVIHQGESTSSYSTSSLSSGSSYSSDSSYSSVPDGFYPLYKVKDVNYTYLDSDEYHFKTDINYTIFYFSYIDDDWWDKIGEYTIYIGHNDKSVSLFNSFSNVGVSLVHIFGSNYKFKKLIAGNGVTLFENQDQVLIQSGQTTCYFLPQSFDQTGDVDLRYGNFQIFYTQADSSIVDVINTLNFYSSNSSDSSSSIANEISTLNLQDSESTSDTQSISFYSNVMCVSILLYKPKPTTFSYKGQIILNRYDVGWFTFTVKKIFGKLFIGQPSRIITDYVLEG